jgi:hypothetical protein
MKPLPTIAAALIALSPPALAASKYEPQNSLAPECWRDMACVESKGAMVSVRHKAALPFDIDAARYAEQHCPGVKTDWSYIRAWKNEVQTSAAEIETVVAEAPFSPEKGAKAFCSQLKRRPILLQDERVFYLDPRDLFLSRGR